MSILFPVLISLFLFRCFFLFHWLLFLLALIFILMSILFPVLISLFLLLLWSILLSVTGPLLSPIFVFIASSVAVLLAVSIPVATVFVPCFLLRSFPVPVAVARPLAVVVPVAILAVVPSRLLPLVATPVPFSVPVGPSRGGATLVWFFFRWSCHSTFMTFPSIW